MSCECVPLSSPTHFSTLHKIALFSIHQNLLQFTECCYIDLDRIQHFSASHKLPKNVHWIFEQHNGLYNCSKYVRQTIRYCKHNSAILRCTITLIWVSDSSSCLAVNRVWGALCCGDLRCRFLQKLPELPRLQGLLARTGCRVDTERLDVTSWLEWLRQMRKNRKPKHLRLEIFYREWCAEEIFQGLYFLCKYL